MIPKAWQDLFAKRRDERTRAKRVRKLRSLRHMGSTRVQLGSREYVNFSSNDYLGLAGDLRIAEAAAGAAGRFGWGTGASRLVTGTSTLHQKLESDTARFRGTQAALVFGSGYQANLGVLSTLLDKGDIVLSDEMNHSSIVAGCKLSGATVRVFRHRDYEDLERKLAGGNARKLVVTDTLFSIEGDSADLARIIKLCDRHGALLVADDAHANAALGKKGRGIAELQNVLQHVPIVVGTFSKALGSYGGFVACSEEVRELLVNESRPFIYTTSMPIALAAANIEALNILHREGETLRLRLQQNVKFLRTRLESLDFKLTGQHHIVGIRIGDPEKVTFIADEVEKQSLLAYPMRWPSVPLGQDTVRISVSAAHTEDEIMRLASALRAARDRMGGKDTMHITKREAKRPTHQNLDVAVSDDLDESAFADDSEMAQPISAVDSNRLPPPHEVADFAPAQQGAGDTMIQQPASQYDGGPGIEVPTDNVHDDAAEMQVSASGRLPVIDSSESGGFESLLDDVLMDAAGEIPGPAIVSEAATNAETENSTAQQSPAQTPQEPASETAAENSGKAADDAAEVETAEKPDNAADPAAPLETELPAGQQQSVPESAPQPKQDQTAVESGPQAATETGQGDSQAPATTAPEPAAGAPSAQATPESSAVAEQAAPTSASAAGSAVQVSEADESDEDDTDVAPQDGSSADTLAADPTATIVPDAPVAGPGSGDTLSPEQQELPDPVIAEIEGGTRRRKREKTRRRTRGLTRGPKKG